MLEHEKTLVKSILLGSIGLVAVRALANTLLGSSSAGSKTKALPDFDASKTEDLTKRKRNLSPKALIEYKYKTSDGYIIYNYSTDLNTDEINVVYCPLLLSNNDLEALIFSKTAPCLGLASDLKMTPPRWAMAGVSDSQNSIAIRSKLQNKALIAKYLKKDASSTGPLNASEKDMLMQLLEVVEGSLKLYETECSFDANGQKIVEKISVLDTQRILAAALWTAVQASASTPYLKFGECVLEMIKALIENNLSLTWPSKNKEKYKSFVDCFSDGWFNCETPGATKLYVISSPDILLRRDMIPSKSRTADKEPVAFPPSFEPIFISGAVFYASSF